MGTWLNSPMQFFSLLGNDIFFLLVAPVIFWSIDAALGLRLGLFLMISASVNEALKLFMHQPRPYWFSPRVTAFSSESSFGIPSGHAQNAVVVWGTIASYIHKAWAWIAAIALILLIGLSRLYLAVHFPSDVLVGWLIGAVLLWILLKSEKPLLKWFKPLSRSSQLLLALAGSIALILLNVLARATPERLEPAPRLDSQRAACIPRADNQSSRHQRGFLECRRVLRISSWRNSDPKQPGWVTTLGERSGSACFAICWVWWVSR